MQTSTNNFRSFGLLVFFDSIKRHSCVVRTKHVTMNSKCTAIEFHGFNGENMSTSGPAQWLNAGDDDAASTASSLRKDLEVLQLPSEVLPKLQKLGVHTL